jgi:cell fate regulator YaaT (PSP1 superfamily)
LPQQSLRGTMNVGENTIVFRKGTCMPRVVGISFRKVGKVYFFDPGDLSPREGDFVIAETARGLEFGEVMAEVRDVTEEELVAPLKKIVRLATGEDLEREADNRESEKRAYDICQKKVTEHNLPMKLLDAERSFDGAQITFYFSAENRVDFRDLVKDLSSILNLKVQLHQIGVRDEAKLLGGYGTCGRSLCCATFLSNFEPVSMKMAKDQSLFLNPAKFSGVCGKLMCCLKYEHETYRDSKRWLPSIGAIVETPRGQGKVIDVNIISEMLTVELEDQVSFQIAATELNLAGVCRKHGCGCPLKDQGCQPLSDR